MSKVSWFFRGIRTAWDVFYTMAMHNTAIASVHISFLGAVDEESYNNAAALHDRWAQESKEYEAKVMRRVAQKKAWKEAHHG
jgi:hypothetical protein